MVRQVEKPREKEVDPALPKAQNRGERIPWNKRSGYREKSKIIRDL